MGNLVSLLTGGGGNNDSKDIFLDFESKNFIFFLMCKITVVVGGYLLPKKKCWCWCLWCCC